MIPDVSIVVPCYNVEKYIERCALSIKKQDYNNFEVIFVDDGSQDNTGKLLDALIMEDKRFKVIHKANGGVASARNVGINVGKGKYIAFIDADDWVCTNWLSILVNSLEMQKYRVDIAGCNLVYRIEYDSQEAITIDKSYIEILGTENILKYLFKHPSTRGDGLLGRAFVWNKLYRKSIIEEYDIQFNEQIAIGEDYQFNYDYMRHCHTGVFNKTGCYNYLQNSDSMMSFIRSHKTFCKQMIEWPIVFDNIYEQIFSSYPEISKCCEAMAVRLYIRCLFGMICTKYIDNGFERKAVGFIKRHFLFKSSFDMDGSVKYLVSAYFIKVNYQCWKLLMSLVLKITN